MKDYCVSCEMKKEGFIDEFSGWFKCNRCHKYQEEQLAFEQQKEQEYFHSLSSEEQAEIKSEFALAGVLDAPEYLGY